MNKDRKIELQTKIIHDLQAENKSLSTRVKELEKIVNDDKQLIELADNYRIEHEKNLNALTEAKEKYLKAVKDITEQRKTYKKEMDELLKTIKKNIK